MSKNIMNIVITGGSSGLGDAIIGKIYQAHKDNIIWKETEVNVYNIDIQPSRYSIQEKAGNFNVHSIHFDLTDEAEYKYQDLIDHQLPAKIDILINNCGVNYIEWIDKIDMEQYDALFNINVRSVVLIVKNSLEKLRFGTMLNIISNASDMAMTNSLAYNGSKGAMKIMTKQMSRELGKTHNITVFGISPNKLNDTQMSRYIDDKVCDLRGWSKEEAQKYQVSGLPCGEETDKDSLAEFIVFLLSSKRRHKFLQGCILPYGGPMSN
jgi:NAD(P)-dependent dehydrogenase (short-subunit alcohol dehydrogenase family)